LYTIQQANQRGGPGWVKGGAVPADEDLFRAWQSGDAGALTALVERYHAPLLTHLVRLIGQRQVAEDLTQETFVRLVREAAAYRYPRPFRPWLYSPPSFSGIGCSSCC
jgi:hypothetical protein